MSSNTYNMLLSCLCVVCSLCMGGTVLVRRGCPGEGSCPGGGVSCPGGEISYTADKFIGYLLLRIVSAQMTNQSPIILKISICPPPHNNSTRQSKVVQP